MLLEARWPVDTLDATPCKVELEYAYAYSVPEEHKAKPTDS